MYKKLIATALILAMLLSLMPTANAAPVDVGALSTNSYPGTLSDTSDLLFEFDNREKDQQRYKNAAYGGLNFDQETNGYWATGYNGSYTAYNIVNSGGTLRVHVT